MTQLPGVVRAADSGLLGFDANTIITAAIAADMKTRGYSYCIRYVSRAPKQNSFDLSAAEAQHILGAGLALMVVQHPRAEGFSITPGMGGSDGVFAAYHAFVLGFPPGVNVWCDLEGIAAGTGDNDVVTYCNDWFDAVAAAGYLPGVYVGAQSILDGSQLFLDLKFDHYWKSLSNVPDIETRGYQMIQSNEHVVGGIQIDNNLTRTDDLGGKVQWLAPV